MGQSYYVFSLLRDVTHHLEKTVSTQFITLVQRYTYARFLMRNLIRPKQLRKQEAEIAKKTHGKALLEQFFSQTPKDFTSNRPYTRKFSS